MIQKRLGLSSEPQPVFVGSCFALIMLLMQFYIIQITPAGKLLTAFNSPIALFFAMQGIDTLTIFFLWCLQTITPVAIVLFGAVFGKKHAWTLAIPAFLLVVRGVIALAFASTYTPYYATHILYIVTFAFYLVSITGIIKTLKPFIIYASLLCVAVAVATLLKKPPFTLFDNSIYLSDMIYFITYHIALINFARAIPIQKAEKFKKASEKEAE